MTPHGAQLLDDVVELLGRYVAFPSPEARAAVALWVVHAHAVEAFDSTPRLALLSPEKGSGKTRTLEVLGLLVPEPMHTVNVSAAALYRVVAKGQPTLLLDEADTYLGLTVAKQHEELRGLINAGHRSSSRSRPWHPGSAHFRPVLPPAPEDEAGGSLALPAVRADASAVAGTVGDSGRDGNGGVRPVW